MYTAPITLLVACLCLIESANAKSAYSPSKDISPDDWKRCHGLPCAKWDQTLNTIKLINSLSAKPKTGSMLKSSSRTEDIKVNEAAPVPDNVQQTEDNEADDVWLSPEQAESLLKIVLERQRTKKPKSSRKKRKVDNFAVKPTHKWRLPILYKFDGTHSESEKDIIRQATVHWSSKTCIRFFEVNKDAYLSNSHLMFTSYRYSCASFIGKQTLSPGIAQQVNLASTCLTKFGVPVHEIGHALGMWHEHQNPTRDESVNVLFDNVAQYYRSNFEQWPASEIEEYGLPYDFNSVMHYGGKVASRNGQTTIRARNPLFQNNMGQRIGLSFLDAKVLNMAYCTEYCPRRTLSCKHGGYQDPNNCDVCRCPDGLAGDDCSILSFSRDAVCGGNINLRVGETEVRAIETPGYSHNTPYSVNTQCNWMIRAPTGYRVMLEFEDDFTLYCSDRRCFHWVEVHTATDFGIPGPRFCCYDRPQTVLTSDGEAMLVVFRSDFSSSQQSRAGFRAKLSIVPAPSNSDGSASGNGAANPNPDANLPTVTNPGDFDSEMRPNQRPGETGGSTTQESSTVQTVEQQTTSVTMEQISQVMTTEVPAETWSDWSACSYHACKCGGCSTKSRSRLCYGQPCQGDRAITEEVPCYSRACTADDVITIFVGTFYNTPCPKCCVGYTASGDTCRKRQ